MNSSVCKFCECTLCTFTRIDLKEKSCIDESVYQKVEKKKKNIPKNDIIMNENVTIADVSSSTKCQHFHKTVSSEFSEKNCEIENNLTYIRIENGSFFKFKFNY